MEDGDRGKNERGGPGHGGGLYRWRRDYEDCGLRISDCGSAGQDEAGEAEAAAEGVLDVFGEDAVDGVGLVAGQDGQPSRGAVGFDVEDVLHDAEEAGVERDAVGKGAFAAPAHDAAAGGAKAIGDF